MAKKATAIQQKSAHLWLVCTVGEKTIRGTYCVCHSDEGKISEDTILIIDSSRCSE